MQEQSQGLSHKQLLSFPNYQFHTLRHHTLNRAWLGRVAGAGVLAMALLASLNTPAFASSAPVKDRVLRTPLAERIQQDSGPEDEAQDSGTDEAAKGVVIVAVDERGPAAQAGIARGDILLSIDGKTVDSESVLVAAITAAKPGDEVEVVVQHGDETRTLTVTLGQRGERAYLGVQVVGTPEVAAPQIVSPLPDAAPVPGVRIEVVTATVTSTNTVVDGEAGHATRSFGAGIIVAEVLDDGPAAQAGLAAGDRLLAINSVPLSGAEELIRELEAYSPGDTVTLTVHKGGTTGAVIDEVEVTLEAAPDDPERAYLGVRLAAIYMAPPVHIQVAPSSGDVAPPLPELPDAGPRHEHGHQFYIYPGTGPLPHTGEMCGGADVSVFHQTLPSAEVHFFQAAPLNAAPVYAALVYAAPVPPMPSVSGYGVPVMHAAPVQVYHHGTHVVGVAPSAVATAKVTVAPVAPSTATSIGIAPQVFSVATPEGTQENVIILRRLPEVSDTVSAVEVVQVEEPWY